MTYVIGPDVDSDGVGRMAWTNGTAADLLRDLPDLWRAADDAERLRQEETDR
jgi:hypothetical protein